MPMKCLVQKALDKQAAYFNELQKIAMDKTRLGIPLYRSKKELTDLCVPEEPCFLKD